MLLSYFGSVMLMTLPAVSDNKSKADAVLCLPEFEALARPCLSEMAYAYISGGAADEITMRANSEDWKAIRLCPRVLVDVSEISLRTEIIGQALDSPIMLAPAAFHRLCHAEDCELATVQGANAAGAAMVLSSFSTVSLAEVAAAARHPLWFQLYFQADRGMTQEMVRRAEAAGCKALCLTVDTAVLGARHHESRTPFTLTKKFKLTKMSLGTIIHT